MMSVDTAMETIPQTGAQAPNDGEYGEVAATCGTPQSIRLDRLYVSEQNVRTSRDPEGLPALAASILSAGGLINPLTVIASAGEGDGERTYGVIAGGRRLAALHMLVEQGAIAPDALVSCNVVLEEQGTAVSLMENATQQPMHPLDQLSAFKRLSDQGWDVERIATSFGVSVLTVERRLRLAAVAPQFLDLYREGKLRMDQLMALALEPDQERQVAVWNSLPLYGRSPYGIRYAIAQEEVPGDDGVARFVGRAAYEQAGGGIRRDLFGNPNGDADDGEGAFFTDPTLLQSLALAKLETVADEVREQGWAWVEATVHFDRYQSGYGWVRPELRDPNEEEAARLDEIESEMAALEERMAALEDEAEGDEESLQERYEAEEKKYEALRKAKAKWERSFEVYTPEQRATCGAVITIDLDGTLKTVTGLRRREDAQKTDGGDGAGLNYMPSQPAPAPKGEYNKALTTSLTAARSRAVALALFEQPKVALAALVASLAVADDGQMMALAGESPLEVTSFVNEAVSSPQASDVDAMLPGAHIKARLDAIAEAAHGKQCGADVFAAALAQSEEQLLKTLAAFVGRRYTVMHDGVGYNARMSKRSRYPMAQAIEAALGFDMADWWEPDEERFFRRVPKSKIVEAVTEACDPEAAKPLAGMKKGDAAKKAAELLKGKRWLPSLLRPYEIPEDEAAEAVSDSDEDGEADDQSDGD